MRVSTAATFTWKLLLIGIVSAKGIWKKFPNLQVGGPAPAPPTLSVIRVVLPHTEACDRVTQHCTLLKITQNSKNLYHLVTVDIKMRSSLFRMKMNILRNNNLRNLLVYNVGPIVVFFFSYLQRNYMCVYYKNIRY